MTKQPISLEAVLQQEMGLTSFRIGQKEIISDILRGQDVLGILPTGSGKSLCYELPARILQGKVLVVSPLISLMMDQVKRLKAKQFKAAVAINSFMDFPTRKAIIERLDTYKLIFVSPEQLQSQSFINRLLQINIDLFVIDEAHCISQWGHEFRPDYQRLGPIITALDNPVVLALTATATNYVQRDILTSLNRPDIQKHIYPMDRENIAISIQHVEKEDNKNQVIASYLSARPVPTLIYFTSRMMTEEVASRLLNQFPHRRIAYYHGGMDQVDRISIQQQFMNDQIDIVCCTSAFGMGIDKSNIRLVIHYHFPYQMEAYIQEAGRAGRDGQDSVSLILYSKADEILPRRIIQQELPSEQVVSAAFQILKNYAEQGISIPHSSEEIETIFQMNEVQWRFFYYQLEKHDIIVNNAILFHHETWTDAYRQIQSFIQERIQLKENKLQSMLQWVNETVCLRQTLYSVFQPTYKQPTGQCCSNCGFELNKWNPSINSIEKIFYDSWEESLRSKLLIGAEYETK